MLVLKLSLPLQPHPDWVKTEENREEDPLRYKAMKHMKTGFGDRHQGLILTISYIALVDFFISLSFSFFIYKMNITTL